MSSNNKKETSLTTGNENSLARNKVDGFDLDFGYEVFEQSMKICEAISQSGIVPNIYTNAPRKIFVASAMGARFGLDPLQSMQSIAVINGSPALWGDAVKAIVLASGKAEYVYEDAKAMEEAEKASTIYKKILEKYNYDLEKVAFCVTKRTDSDEINVAYFTIDQAKEADLLKKDNWKKYAPRMLKLRARSFSLRDTYPDILKGYKTVEEVTDDGWGANAEVANNIDDVMPDVEASFEDVTDKDKKESPISPDLKEEVATETKEVSFEELNEEEDLADSGELAPVAVYNEKAVDQTLISLDMTASDAIEQINIIEDIDELKVFAKKEYDLNESDSSRRKTVAEAFIKRGKELSEAIHGAEAEPEIQEVKEPDATEEDPEDLHSCSTDTMTALINIISLESVKELDFYVNGSVHKEERDEVLKAYESRKASLLAQEGKMKDMFQDGKREQ